MSYEEALAFWYGRINYEVRSAGPGDLKLERMRALLRRLGDPHERLRLVHVTGTKGKGSTCAMLESILRAAGYRVGLFTSPHLTRVEERMQVDRVPIAPNELAALMSCVAPAVRALEEDARYPPPTFFEIGTALGFLHFVHRRCDVAIIEVGLGGRFDSTNVCRPLVSIITNIGFDHMAQLGSSLQAIAFQKAGIIKRRVPIVSGVVQDGPRAVVRQVAAELNAPVWEVERPSTVATRLTGAHQAQNASLAIAAIERLRSAGMPIVDGAIVRGLAEVRWPARIEQVAVKPIVVLDTAHNVPSSEALVATLRTEFPVAGRKRVVFAVSADKQVAEVMRVLADHFDRFYLTKYGNNPRSVSPEKLAAVLAANAPRIPFSTHATSAEALHAALAEAKEDDLVCVTGSVFLAGELRPLLVATP
jgi:dihydrofolate synthase/folylpolyglutamate synthase